ncbi:MAG: hypothetical protein J2P45_25100, partial [Candidatus Dormibacteraeota bacterium]|nr:hypothetical protein [Candidatus Dormibacteraeota bacterium]
MRRRLIRLAWLVPALSLVAVSGAAGQGALAANQSPAAQATSNCHLQSPGGKVQHVVNLVFDNVHLTRDNPNVPSDLEQMPNLLNFITGNGTMISHEHTPLIAHTATDILSSLTGLYGDRMGIPIANSFGYYNTNAAASFSSSFGYWTDHLNGSNDKTFLMTTENGKNTPAPWVPFTRTGCDYGAAGTANLEFENTNPDIPNVFGAGSPEDLERQQNNAKATADFVGIAIHCGKGEQVCSQATGARPDLLPDEPGGYSGFSALYGAKYTDALISPNGPLQSLDGNV